MPVGLLALGFLGRGCLAPTIRSLVMRAHFPTERAAAMRKVAGA